MGILAATGRRRRNQHGFTLLEAIVALVVFAATMLAVYSWINTSLISLNKARQTQFIEQIIKQAPAYFQGLDLSRVQQSHYFWKTYRVNWQARLLEPVKQGKNSMGLIGLYDMALYQIRLDILNPQQHLIASYNMDLLNYKKVRSLQYE